MRRRGRKNEAIGLNHRPLSGVKRKSHKLQVLTFSKFQISEIPLLDNDAFYFR